uniref:Leptin receptor overlapping transcript-like 1 n=1 Tax=Timema cristinae TaxID=61476 RepID=A0A7R9GTM3_TIMCR|nr:unnamed protein product [Timema cristinae]
MAHDIKKVDNLWSLASLALDWTANDREIKFRFSVWWPFFVVLFYILSPVPTLIARRYNENSGNSSPSVYEVAIFITMGFVVSSFALPIVLSRALVIQWGACFLTLAANVVVYATLLGFFLTFDSDDADYSMW